MPLTAPAIRGYAQTADLAAFLSVTFTPAQEAQAAATIARVETWFDNQTNRTWLSGPVIDEAFFAPFAVDPPTMPTNPAAGWVPMGASLLLRRTPVQSVERVAGVPYLNQPPIDLIRDVEWEVRDLETGIVRMLAPSGYYQVRVSYSPVDVVPADVTQAVVMMAATWLLPTINPDVWGIESYRLPDLEVRFAKSTNSLGVPLEVQDIIDQYRWVNVG